MTERKEVGWSHVLMDTKESETFLPLQPWESLNCCNFNHKKQIQGAAFGTRPQFTVAGSSPCHWGHTAGASTETLSLGLLISAWSLETTSQQDRQKGRAQSYTINPASPLLRSPPPSSLCCSLGVFGRVCAAQVLNRTKFLLLPRVPFHSCTTALCKWMYNILKLNTHY